jgi:hypothetical protein
VPAAGIELSGGATAALRRKSPGLADLGDLNPALSGTQLAGRRIDSASGMGRLRDLWKSCAVAGGAYDFRRRVFRFQFVHSNHFPDTAPTPAMSLCKTDCWLRLSHFNVTPDQFVSVTVAWSFLSSRQQTRAPTLNDLDSEPVIHFAVSVRFRLTVTLAA